MIIAHISLFTCCTFQPIPSLLSLAQEFNTFPWVLLCASELLFHLPPSFKSFDWTQLVPPELDEKAYPKLQSAGTFLLSRRELMPLELPHREHQNLIRVTTCPLSLATFASGLPISEIFQPSETMGRSWSGCGAVAVTDVVGTKTRCSTLSLGETMKACSRVSLSFPIHSDASSVRRAESIIISCCISSANQSAIARQVRCFPSGFERRKKSVSPQDRRVVLRRYRLFRFKDEYGEERRRGKNGKRFTQLRNSSSFCARCVRPSLTAISISGDPKSWIKDRRKTRSCGKKQNREEEEKKKDGEEREAKLKSKFLPPLCRLGSRKHHPNQAARFG